MSNSLNLTFLGSSGCIQVPSFHCSCRTCEEARKDPKLRKTRASIVLSGQENILIDASPDIEFQLEREKMRFIDRMFLTHWHFDHCWGIAPFPELSTHGIWEKNMIDLYLPSQDVGYFDRDFSWAKSRFKIHPLNPGDFIELPDATFEVVKTTHSIDSVGYIITTPRKTIAYLVDGIIPPTATIERLKEINLDIIILEGTVDELVLPEGEQWYNFSISEAISFWKTLNVPICMLTHASFHSWNINKLVAGITPSERKAIEDNNPGLSFAFDGLKIDL
ncbi:MAG: MBL fold metallo-hydrolase [Promethearchaeota archaeon]|jgi:phosphoribosyl 1,2-cyclic phosphate phosphodiesterase